MDVFKKCLNDYFSTQPKQTPSLQETKGRPFYILVAVSDSLYDQISHAKIAHLITMNNKDL